MFDTYERLIGTTSADDAEREYQRIRARLFAYEIFPPASIRGTVCPEQPFRRGATIVQRFGPKAVAIETGVRVEAVWDDFGGETAAAGFVYMTLKGHLERGVSRFEVQRSGAQVRISVAARSRPGNWLTDVTWPLARWLQRSLTSRAVLALATRGT